jgi:hypothetical protein
MNSTNAVAEVVRYQFTLFDLDVNFPHPLPIPVKEISYIRALSHAGPNILLGQYGTLGHRYFGYAIVTCRNCKGGREVLLAVCAPWRDRGRMVR